MKALTYSVLIVLNMCLFSCSHEKKKDNDNKVNPSEKGITGEPEIHIKVNKQYDKNGLLISYDSTYSSYYSSRKDDKKLIDSLIEEFKPLFSERFPLINDEYFDKLFFEDSMLYIDFFHKDFFKKRMELNVWYINKMLHEMDSVKNEFFKKQSKELKKGK